MPASFGTVTAPFNGFPAPYVPLQSAPVGPVAPVAPHEVKVSVAAAAGVHTPAVQVSPAAQTLPHAPQLLVSDCSGPAQPLGQSTCPPVHGEPQTPMPLPFWQLPASHTRPHIPQLWGSVLRLAQ